MGCEMLHMQDSMSFATSIFHSCIYPFLSYLTASCLYTYLETLARSVKFNPYDMLPSENMGVVFYIGLLFHVRIRKGKLEVRRSVSCR